MKNLWQPFTLSALALSGTGIFSGVAAEAVQLADGRIVFDRPPNLVEATTLDYAAGFEGTYHFVIEVPDNAGEALGAIVVTPRDHARDVVFNLDASEAQLSTAYANGPRVELSSVGGRAENPDEVLVVFDDPVQPGETVTVSLETDYNPRGGVYLFGVTAYPAGDNSVGQFLGYGRIHIFDADN
ncbi:MAG: DUF2808 domain-containing protein [Leptolyngbya sp. SIOISBB]|nr:DUF2808 domain-containing protein [Leptolyngbya sp. SIOISBB]